MATARQLPADVYPETLSRLPPLKRQTLNEAQQKAYDAVTAPRSGRLNLAGIKGPGGVILRMPKLAKPWATSTACCVPSWGLMRAWLS